MRKGNFVFALLMVYFTMSVSVFGVEAPLRIKAGFFKLEPHVMGEEGDKMPTGATIDLWNDYLAKEMNVQIEWVGPLPLLRLHNMLESGKLDLAVLMAKNEEREKKFLYPKTEYTKMKPGIAVLKTSGITEIKVPSDLYGKKIGYFSGGFLPPFMKNKNLKIENISSSNWLEFNYLKLKAKRIDAFYQSEIVSTKYSFKKLGDYGLFNFIELPGDANAIYSVFSKQNADLMAKYEAALATVYKKITYEQLLDKYLNEQP